MALLVFASLLLALPQPMAEPLPVPEKRPATGALPAGLLKGEGGAMHAWYCGQPGNEAALPCLVQQLRALPKGPERDALQLKIREAPKPNWGRGAEGKGGGGEGKGGGGAGAGLLGPQGRDVVSAMHEGWCALKENAESALCLKWRESAQRRYVAAEEHGQSGPLAVPQLASCASSGRAWRLTARHSQGEARPLGPQPLPRVLELAASRAAESTAFEHAGAAGRRAPGAAGPQARQDHEGGARGGPATAGGGLTRLDLYRTRQLLIAYGTHQL